MIPAVIDGPGGSRRTDLEQCAGAAKRQAPGKGARQDAPDLVPLPFPGGIMRPTPTLKRVITLPVITLYGLGTTIGAGIYVLIGEVAGEAGAWAPLSFLAAAVLAGFSGFSFAELSARFPRSAGEALYVREGLRSPALALLVGLLVVAAGTISAAMRAVVTACS